MRFWISILLFVTVLSFDNFQQRIIYLSPYDNVCHFGEKSDRIRITINIDGVETKNVVGLGGTYCRQWAITDAASIEPADYWLAASEDFKEYYLQFDDESTRIYRGGVLSSIVQTTRVRRPVTLKGAPYNCDILGDGQVQHFGIDFPDFPPAQIYLRCNKVTADPESIQKQ